MNVLSSITLTPKQQAYLERIRELSERNGATGTTALARQLGVSLPSVSESVSRLEELGYVKRLSRWEIALTPAGGAVVEELAKRQQVLLGFMTEFLGMSDTEAEAAACDLEHHVEPSFIARLAAFADSLRAGDTPPRGKRGRH